MKIPHNYRTKNKNDLPELVRSLWTLFFVVVVVNLSKVFVVADVSFGIYRSIDCSFGGSFDSLMLTTDLVVCFVGLFVGSTTMSSCAAAGIAVVQRIFLHNFLRLRSLTFHCCCCSSCFCCSLGYFVNKFIHKTEIIHSLKRKRRRRRCGGGGGCRWCILHFKDLRLAVLTILHKWRRARYYYAWVCV